MSVSSRPKPLKRLSPALRRRFDIAWKLMPAVLQHALKPFIIRVEERESLEGAEIRVGGRVVATSETDCQGRAMIAEVGGQWFGAMLLKSDTAVIAEGPAVAIICHELAHALQHVPEPPGHRLGAGKRVGARRAHVAGHFLVGYRDQGERRREGGARARAPGC